MLKTNQIYKDLISMIDSALKSHKLNWQIIQTYQQTSGTFKAPFIMLHRLTSSNYGWQYGKDKEITDETGEKQLIHTETQIEILKFQIEAYRPRLTKDTVNTITATDVIRLIARWFMSQTGIQAVRDKGYNILRISEVVEEYYKEVNEIYQVNPHFTMELVTEQTDITEALKISDFTGRIEAI